MLNCVIIRKMILEVLKGSFIVDFEDKAALQSFVPLQFENGVSAAKNQQWPWQATSKSWPSSLFCSFGAEQTRFAVREFAVVLSSYVFGITTCICLVLRLIVILS